MNVGYSLNQILINDKKKIFFLSEVGEGRGDGGGKKTPTPKWGWDGEWKTCPIAILRWRGCLLSGMAYVSIWP